MNSLAESMCACRIHFFSTDKNNNSVKVLVGATQGGLTSYIKPASVSDRQLAQRSPFLYLREPGNSMLSDKDFNKQN